MIADIGGGKLLLTFRELQQCLPSCTMHLRGQSIRRVPGMTEKCPWHFGDPHLSLDGKVGKLCCHWEPLLSCFFPNEGIWVTQQPLLCLHAVAPEELYWIYYVQLTRHRSLSK